MYPDSSDIQLAKKINSCLVIQRLTLTERFQKVSTLWESICKLYTMSTGFHPLHVDYTHSNFCNCVRIVSFFHLLYDTESLWTTYL